MVSRVTNMSAAEWVHHAMVSAARTYPTMEFMLITIDNAARTTMGNKQYPGIW